MVSSANNRPPSTGGDGGLVASQRMFKALKALNAPPRRLDARRRLLREHHEQGDTGSELLVADHEWRHDLDDPPAGPPARTSTPLPVARATQAWARL